MKLTFLGASHGLPEAHRRCSCTMITLGQNETLRTYFIDMGMDATEELVNRGIPMASTKAIFITHMHGDHTNGLFAFVDLATWCYKTSQFKVFLSNEAMKTTLNSWMGAIGNEIRDGIEYDLVKTGVLYDDGFLKVTAYPTEHCADSYAFLVEAEGKRILFTGDLKHKNPSADFPVECARELPLDLAVCEAAHFDATAYAPIFKDLNVKSVVYNHYQSKKIGSIYQMIADFPNLPQRLATDGLEINF